MELISQSFKILTIDENATKTMELAGRTCYKSEDKITEDSSERFVKMLRDRKHHAMLEFGDITVRFITNRGVTHELVRHRLCSFAQESTRYVNYKGKMQFIKPVWWATSSNRERTQFLESMEESEKRYNNLLKLGWAPQKAREVLPNALKTEIVVKANTREWRHIFDLRCSKAAHPQIRMLMIPLLEEIKDIIPVVFDDLWEKHNPYPINNKN